MELGEYDTIKRRTKPYAGKERLIGAINRGCDCKRCGTMSGDGVSSDNLVYSWWLANVNETRNDSYMCLLLQILVTQSIAAFHGSKNNIMPEPQSKVQALLGIVDKKLYRLPFRSNTNVVVEETLDCFQNG
ncbi:uncharacterized protein HKW66_Vig0120210 [Vigna angularis]|uniref:Uncharacterized protein n=1 Tax=Phaseolus angularis TaxID=3914 RepID=A0A8T0JW90_PHAAN|nr:uncharacterized protein HKW66_Vig0120210 [Vigna angularis]